MSGCSCNGCNHNVLVRPTTKIESYVKVVPASSYVLPVATEDILGGIKIGDGLSISEDGVLSVTGEIVNPPDDEPGTTPSPGGDDDTNGDIATDEEVDDTLDDIFGEDDPPENNEPPEEENGDVATDEEVDDMLDDIFGV